MKIIQVIDTLNLGGAERMVVNISNTFVEEGHDVTLLVTREVGPLSKKIFKQVRLLCLFKKSIFDFFALARLYKIINEIRPDIIHAHSSSIFWILFIKLFKKDLFIIWHDHNGKRNELRVLKNIFYIIFSPLLNRIISVNQELKAWSLKYMLLDSNYIEFIPNFPFLSIAKEIKKNELNILYLANLRHPKDHLNFLESINLLEPLHQKKINKVFFVGKHKQDHYYNEIIEYINSNRLNDLVEIIGSDDNVETFLYNSKIGIISSVSEGLPVSLLEYGLAGLAVIVTDVGQCAEVVGFGKYGKVISIKNPQELANALIYYLDNQSNIDGMGLAFKNHIYSNYGPKNFCNQYFQLVGKE